MYQVLIALLLVLNLSLLGWNLLLVPERSPKQPPLVETGIPSLQLASTAAPVAYSSSRADTQSSCYTVGPYNSSKAAQLVARKIRDYGLAVQIRSMRSTETLNFLVYIPPLETHQQAQKIVDDIAKNDVQDASIVDAGPYRNAISLGFFSDLDRARRHAEYIRYLGYDARYTEQQVVREVFWLDYDEPFGSNVPIDIWSKSVDPTVEIQRIPRACR